MIRRVERENAPLKRLGISRKREALVPLEETRDPELALNYSNGFVTVEISYDALDAYIESTGDVPLPVVTDRETGDRRAYDARHKVRVVYDREAKLREVSSRSRDGLFIRVNFPERDPQAKPAATR
jgi:hypothetical protein